MARSRLGLSLTEGISLRRTLAVLGSLWWGINGSLQAASIKSFSPQGTVKNISQVLVQFSEAVVPMGDARTTLDPMQISCNLPLQKLPNRSDKKDLDKLAYTTRWVDAERWSLDFVDSLPAGVKCQLQINPNFKDLKAQALTATSEAKLFQFDSGGPSLVASFPPRDYSADTQQVFLLVVDTGVEASSLRQHVHFEIEGEPGKVAPIWIEGQEQDTLLAQEPIKQFLRQQNLSKSHEKAKLLGKQILLVKAARRFPEQKRVVLHWAKGVRSKSGIELTEPQTLSWWTPEDFKAKLNCQRTAEERGCSPLSDIQVNFTRGVLKSALAGTLLRAKDGTSWQARELQGSEASSDGDIWGLSFAAPFPASSEFELLIPQNLRASDGSLLSNQASFPLTFKTDVTPPLLKFAAPFGILEAKANPVLPVSVRNIEFKSPLRQKSFPAQSINLNSQSSASEIITWYKRIRDKENAFFERNDSIFGKETTTQSFSLPTPTDPKHLNLVGIPLAKPGFHIVEIESPTLGEVLTEKGPMFVAAGALVTDMAVHFKLGRESSLVWVTQLSTGAPVAKAEVAVFDGLGKELIEGKTDEKGIWRISRALLPQEQNDYEARELFAFAKRGDDVSFVSSRWQEGIETYRFQVDNEYLNPRWGPALMHSILDRVSVQPGETVNMKHVLRSHVGSGFAAFDGKQLPLQVLLVHQGTQQVYPLPFEWDENTGTALNSFKVPPEAKLGTYQIYLSASPKRDADASDAEKGQGSGYELWGDQLTGSFRVAEYRLPLVDAQVRIQGDVLVAASQLSVDLSASYLAGGPARGLKSKLRSMLVADVFQPESSETEGMSFYQAPLKEGVFDSYYGHILRDSTDTPPEELAVQELTLDQQGGALAQIKGIKASQQFRRMQVEWEYQDPNGEIRTARSEKAIFPSQTAIGIAAEQWFIEAGKARVKGIIIDPSGKPLAKQSYQIEAFRNTFITHRKKLAGGFYSYDSKVEIKNLGLQCQGLSDADGRFSCDLPKLEAGEYTLQASTKDQKNRPSRGHASISIYRKGAPSWYPAGDSDRMDIVAERAHYEPGEKAKVVVRSPYEQSQVLVTVEREGVLDAYVDQLTRDKPFVEVPIEGHYAPNVFISVLSVRGRVASPQATALIDLAKPSLKMGLSSIKVGWREHKLNVEVSTDKKLYQARDQVDIRIKVKHPTGKALPDNAEVAVIAVDEALLKLKNNNSWDILNAMMRRRALAVSTSTGQLQVIGRRHFGLKAQAPGGGGGQAMGARELFDPMLLWEPRVPLNAKGEANLKVKLNDSMTSFRLVAVALAGDDLFGHGSTLIQSSKDLLILPGFAPLVREGDKIRNSFTVRNTSVDPMQVELVIRSPQLSQLPKLSEIRLGPSEAQVIDVPVNIPAGIKQIQFEITARDSNTARQDTVKITQKVQEIWPARTTQATLLQLDQSQSLELQRPADALPQRGGVELTARSSLTAGLSGVKSYMEEYSYSCLEQKLPRAITLEQKPAIERIIDELPTYMDAQGLLKFFPNSRCGDAQLTRYVLDILASNDYKLPEMVAAQLLSGLSFSIEGRASCSETEKSPTMPRAYEGEAKLRLIEILSRYQRFNPSHLNLVPLTPNNWQTGTVVALARLLRRESSIPDAKRLLEQSEQILRSRLNFQGSLMQLQGELPWQAAWQLWTSPDLEASSVLAYALEQNQTWASELGRMTRGVLARMQNGLWDTSLAIAQGTSSLRRFSQLYETETVTGTSSFVMGEQTRSVIWDKKPLQNIQNLSWPTEGRTSLKLSHEGKGKPWIHLETRAAIPLKGPLDKGYSVKKKLRAISQKQAGTWSVGDVIDVQLEINAQADQPWVVIKDPIPAGASHLGTGLEGESEFLDKGQLKTSGLKVWPAEFEERAQDALLAYAAFLPKGDYRLSYRIRLNAAGVFKLAPTRVEAMYARESFGEAPYGDWTVVP